MPDPQKIVTQIIEFLQTQKSVSRDEIANLARLYAHECSQINARLLRAADYLRLGLLNEAVHASEIEPDLLERSAALDFPLAPQWLEYCSSNNFATAEPLRMEMAQQISAACNDFTKLQELYRRNTLMAIANFPLEKRLANLRVMLQHQPANPAITKNICDLEDKWLDELISAAKNAEKQNDAETMEEIFTKVRSANLLTPLAEKSLAAIRSVHRRFQLALGRRMLDALLPEMEEETAASDEHACRKLRQQWNEILLTHDVEPNTEQARRAEPMFRFLENLDRMESAEREFRQAMSDLAAMLDDETPDMISLRRQYRFLRDMGRAIPQELQERYSRKISAWEMQRKRRVRLIAAAVLIVISLITAAAVYQVRAYRQARYLHKMSENISSAIESKNLESAQKMFTELAADYPSLENAPEIQALRGRYTKTLQDAEQTDAEFKKLTVKIRSAGYDNPDTASLQAAENLAETQAQKLELVEIKNNIAQQLRKKQQAAEKEFSEKLSTVSRQLADIDPALLDSDTELFQQKLREVDKEIAALQATPLVSDEVLATLNPLKATLSSYRKSLDMLLKTREEETRRRKIQQQQAEKLERAIASLERTARTDTKNYASELQNFIKEYPDSDNPGVTQLSSSLKLANCWQAIEQWEDIVSAFSDDMGLSTEKSRAARLAAITQYISAWPESSMTTLAQKYRDFLGKATVSLDANNSWRNELLQVLQSPAMQMDSIKTPDGKIWYMPLNSKPVESTIGLNVYVIDTLDFNKVTKMLFKNLTLQKLAAQPGPSAQTALANDIRDKLMDYGEKNWNSLPLEILAMINSADKVDPILRVNLMEVSLKLVAKACWPEIPELEKAQNRLSTLMMSQVAWPDPKSKTVAESRIRAGKALAGMPDFKKLAMAATNEDKKLRQEIFTTYQPCGIMWQDKSGKSKLLVRTAGSGELFAVLPGSGKLAGIATFSDNAIQPNKKFSEIPAGSIIFERRNGK